jgi:hypothetical protein
MLRYNCLKIVIQAIDEITSPLCFTLHSLGLTITVAVWYATIKTREFLPTLLWALMLTVGIITLILIAIMMPMVCTVNSRSSEGNYLIYRYVLGCKGYRLKYRKRVCKAMEPLKLYTGVDGIHLYFNHAGTRAVYYEAILDNIITAVLS